jgi:hypothetical protein
MSRLTRVIAPLVARAGLDVRAITGADGQVRELVITNPRQPAWGRVNVDREGLMQWAYWGHVADDPGAADIATVITAIMATRPSDHPDRHPEATYLTAAAERGQPHPPNQPGHDRQPAPPRTETPP